MVTSLLPVSLSSSLKWYINWLQSSEFDFMFNFHACFLEIILPSPHTCVLAHRVERFFEYFKAYFLEQRFALI